MIVKVKGEWKRVKEMRLKDGASVPSEIVEDASLMDVAPDFIIDDSDVDKGTQISRALNVYKIARFNYKRYQTGGDIPAKMAEYLIERAEVLIKLLGGRI
jgi:hypothetical protein